MRKVVLTLALAVSIAGCASTTPLPDVRGSILRPLNPTKWDYQKAMERRQSKIGFGRSYD